MGKESGRTRCGDEQQRRSDNFEFALTRIHASLKNRQVFIYRSEMFGGAPLGAPPVSCFRRGACWYLLWGMDWTAPFFCPERPRGSSRINLQGYMRARNGLCRMTHAIRLYHPGGERRLIGRQDVQAGRRVWATEVENHARKFLSANGRYVQAVGGNVGEGQIMFWGEWEPPSNFERLNSEKAGDDGFPRRIHTPVIERIGTRQNLLNTDPYVFGNSFYYSCCLQDRFEKLRHLDPQSLILFGAYIEISPNVGMFYLDTVFVVNEALAPVREVRRNNGLLTDTAYEAIIAPYEGRADVATSQLYSGLMYNNNQECFSYFPCRPENRAQPFARIPVSFTCEELRQLGLRWSYNQTQGYSGKMSVTAEFARQIWQAVTTRVLAAGLSLGVYAQEPVFSHG